jgi:release factor glutamine methyltransferase
MEKNKMTLTPEEMQRVYEIQRGMHQKFRDVPSEGRMVEYLGIEFVVYPEVFWPSWDSQALVKNYRINPGEEVCDVCTGSGVIAIHSAWKGASRVVALDINPNAIKATKENAQRYGLGPVIDTRLSDVFSALKPREKFNVITMNPPMTPHDEEKRDCAEKTTWDEELYLHKQFFGALPHVLKKGGRAYITQANFGAIEDMLRIVDQYKFSSKEIGRTVVDDIRTFYAFELTRKGEAK